MAGRPPPLSVTILAWVYIGVGAVGIFYNLNVLRTKGGLQSDNILVELVRILAVIAGSFMLRGKNWARWLALAWIAFHVVLSAFYSYREFAVHCLFCIVIAWYLLRSDAGRYFLPREEVK